MNYLVTCDRFFGDLPGGAYRIAWELAKVARDEGHTVAMLCGSLPSDPPPGLAEVEGIRVVRYRIPTTRAWNPRRWSLHVRAAREAMRQLLKGTWHRIHGHTPAGALAAFSLATSESECLYTVHSPVILEQRINWKGASLTQWAKRTFGEPVLKSSERQVLESAHRVHVLSDYTRRCLTELYGAHLDARISKIPWWAVKPKELPSRVEARNALGWPAETPTVFTLRRMVSRMGLDVLLQAAARLGQSSDPRMRASRFVLAGDGPMRATLEVQARDLGISDRVSFAGRISDADLDHAYAAADVFALPTLALECFGMITLEAYVHGCPVVASRVGAIPEVMEPIHGEALVPPGDANALAERLEGVLSGRVPIPPPEALQRYAEEQFGRQVIEPRFRAWIQGTSSCTSPSMR